MAQLFEKPLSENKSNLFDSISSWKQIQTMKTPSTLDDSCPSSPSSFNEIISELHFKESSPSYSSSSSPTSTSFPLPFPSYPSSTSSSVLTELSLGIEKIDNKNPTTNFVPSTKKTKHYRHSDSFSSMNSDTLSLCTGGLGLESFDDVEESKSDVENTSTNRWMPPHRRHHRHHHRHHQRRRSCVNYTQAEYLFAGESKRSRISGVEFPPPISSIGMTGKPWVCFKSYRNNGRFVLKEVRIPTQEFLHACREDGRLKLHFISSDDETIEEDDEEDEDIDDRNKYVENEVERNENKGETS